MLVKGRVNRAALAISFGFRVCDAGHEGNPASWRRHDAKMLCNESSVLCTPGRRDFADFLGQYAASVPGEFVDVDSGTVLGSCPNLTAVTIGQRAGIGGAPDRSVGCLMDACMWGPDTPLSKLAPCLRLWRGAERHLPPDIIRFRNQRSWPSSLSAEGLNSTSDSITKHLACRTAGCTSWARMFRSAECMLHLVHRTLRFLPAQRC